MVDGCMRWRRWAVVAGLLIVGGFFAVAVGQRSHAVPASRSSLSVAAAADLKFAMDDLIAAFADERGNVAVSVSYGSSGQFFAQLSSGAPFDIFLSADADYPRRLAVNGLTLPGSDFLYAIGRIVVWAPRAATFDVRALGMETLRHPAVRRVAIANPEHAPYGRAAEAAMRSLGIYDDVRQKLVFGENVAQAAQFVQSRAADVGVIALSLALAPPLVNEGQYWEIPLDAYPRIEQGGVIMKHTRQAAAARAFRDFVLGVRGRSILVQHGFSLPGPR